MVLKLAPKSCYDGVNISSADTNRPNYCKLLVSSNMKRKTAVPPLMNRVSALPTTVITQGFFQDHILFKLTQNCLLLLTGAHYLHSSIPALPADVSDRDMRGVAMGLTAAASGFIVLFLSVSGTVHLHLSHSLLEVLQRKLFELVTFPDLRGDAVCCRALKTLQHQTFTCLSVFHSISMYPF